jgi:hypothetical protein
MFFQRSQNNGGGDDGMYLTLSVLSTCITPLTRSGFGVEGLGMNALLAFVLIVALAGSIPDMQGYVGLWFFCLVMQRLSTLRNVRRGLVVHSRYAGYPYLAGRIVPFVRTESAVLIAEALICLGVGGLIYSVSPAFGEFIIVCAAAMFLKCLLDKAIVHKRIQRMRDAEIEQRWYSEQLRKGVK